MEDIIKILESIGLHKNEILVYLDLIKVGNSSAHDISKRTKIHRTNVYDTLDKLKKKGIVTQSIQNNKKKFYPMPPRTLLKYMRQKENALKSILPQLENVQSKPKEQRRVSTSEGIRAVKSIIDSLLELKEPIYVYGTKTGIEELGGFIEDFHRRRIHKKIPMQYIYGENSSSQEKIKKLNKLPHTEAKCFSQLQDITMTTHVCGNKVILIIWEDPTYAISIESTNIATAYKEYFEILWKKAKNSF